MQILIWITPHFGTKSSGKPALAAEAAKSRNLCDRVFSVRQIGQTPHNSDIVNIGLHFFLKNVRPYAASCSEA